MDTRAIRCTCIISAILLLPPLSKAQQYRATSKDIAAWLVGRTLTIDDAVTVALQTSRTYSLAISELEKARGRTDESKVGLKPQAGLSGAFTYLDREFDATFGGASIPIDNQSNAVYEATISLPIDIGGAVRAAVSQSQFNEVAARIDVNRVRNQVVYQIRYDFFQALRAQDHLAVAQDSLRNRLQQLSDTEKNLAAGLASNFDVITAKRDVADAQQSVIDAQAQITLSLAALKYAMGVDVSTPLGISDKDAVSDPIVALPTIATNEPLRFGPVYEGILQEALGSRPEILEADAFISAAKRGLVYAQKSVLPEVSLFTSYMLDPNSTDLAPGRQGTVGMMINIPIFDGGRSSALRRQAAADLEKAGTNRRGAVDLVTLDVQQAFVNLAQANAKMSVAAVGLAQAKEAYRMARVRFSNGIAQTGVSPQLELTSAQTSLALAEENALNSRYDYSLAESQVERATGRYSYGVGPGYATKPDRKVTGSAPEQGNK